MIHVTKLGYRVTDNFETMVNHQPLCNVTLGNTEPSDLALMSRVNTWTLKLLQLNKGSGKSYVAMKNAMICLINTAKLG